MGYIVWSAEKDKCCINNLQNISDSLPDIHAVIFEIRHATIESVLQNWVHPRIDCPNSLGGHLTKTLHLINKCNIIKLLCKYLTFQKHNAFLTKIKLQF